MSPTAMRERKDKGRGGREERERIKMREEATSQDEC